MRTLPQSLGDYDDPESGWFSVGVTTDGDYVLYAASQSAVHQWHPSDGNPESGTTTTLDSDRRIETLLTARLNEFLVLHPRYQWLAENPVDTMTIETTVEADGLSNVVARTPYGSTLIIPKSVLDTTAPEDLQEHAQACFLELLKLRPTSARTLSIEECELTIVADELTNLSVTERERLCHRLMNACLDHYDEKFGDD